MLQRKALLHRGFADSVPGNVALADVHNALSVIHQVVDLTLEDRLIVLLHLPTGNLDYNRQRQVGPRLHILHVGADHLYPAVFHLVHGSDGGPLHAWCPPTAALEIHILLPDTLTLEGGAVGYRDRHLGDGDLEAPNFDGL